MTISVTLTFHNELEFLDGWFDSVKTYADQIVMAAHNATDGSLEWAYRKQAELQIPITILEFPEDTVFKHGFSYMKNKCIELCTGDWIVCLDADEEMDISKEKIKLWDVGNPWAISTVTMHTTDRKDHWSLLDRSVIRTEAEWIRQRHWRVFRNNLGINWRGLIHEELQMKGKHVAHRCRNSTIQMWHYGSMANLDKRSFKDGLYAELILRVVENPEVRSGTNPWWYTDFYEENKEKLHRQRDEYREERKAKGLL